MPHHNGSESGDGLALNAAALGFVAGLRSQVPISALAKAAKKGDFADRADGPLQYLHSPWTGPVTGAMAVGEIVADKLPFVPSRIKPLPLAGRGFIGGVAGAAIFKNAHRSIPMGLIIGAAAATAGSFAGYHARSFLTKRTGLPGIVFAVVEDALAIGMSRLAVKRYLGN
ncbi:MAG: DUF4126 family protein [Nitrolancea sp.]